MELPVLSLLLRLLQEPVITDFAGSIEPSRTDGTAAAGQPGIDRMPARSAPFHRATTQGCGSPPKRRTASAVRFSAGPIGRPAPDTGRQGRYPVPPACPCSRGSPPRRSDCRPGPARCGPSHSATIFSADCRKKPFGAYPGHFSLYPIVGEASPYYSGSRIHIESAASRHIPFSVDFRGMDRQ